MKCGEMYNLTLLMHFVFGNQHFESIQMITYSQLQNEFFETKKM